MSLWSTPKEILPALLMYNCYLSSLQAIFTAGYKAILHIHSVVEECEIMDLIHQIDPKTKKPIRKKVLFVKNGAVVVVRIQVSISDFLMSSRFFGFLFYYVSSRF